MTHTPDVELPMVSRFSSPDDHPGLEDLVRYLDHVERLDSFRELHALADDWLAIENGQTILDLGCGLGRATREAAHRAGLTGKAVGLDISQALLRLAEARSIEDPTPVYVHGDGAALPFPDDAFDSVRAERLLMHVPDPAVVLSEIHRVLRPGGKLVLIEPDWGALEIRHADQVACHALRASFSTAIKNPAIGAKLSALCHAAGLAIAMKKSHVWRSLRLPEIDLVLQFDRMANLAVCQKFHPGPVETLLQSLRQGPIEARLTFTALVATKLEQTTAG